MFLGIRPIFVLENSWDHANKSVLSYLRKIGKVRNEQSPMHYKYINEYRAEGHSVPQHLQDKLEGIENGLSSRGKLRERSKPAANYADRSSNQVAEITKVRTIYLSTMPTLV